MGGRGPVASTATVAAVGIATFITGDVRDVLATIPDGSIDLVLTSPPFLALRSYLPADHPDKHREIGSEPDPATFLDTLLLLTAEWRRVLAPHGSICVELGDTYSGSGSGGGDYVEGSGEIDMQRGQDFQRRRYTSAWPDAKSLCMIPELYRVALAYGVNPLTGAESPAGRWRCRNVVRWHRPNPPVGALGDKFRPATSDMVIACTSGKRYFDLDAVRTEVRSEELAKAGQASGESYQETAAEGNGYGHGRVRQPHPAGAPPLDTWVIPTAPYAGSHYATFPPALCEKPIKSMVPLKVCRTCGEPSRRIVENPNSVGRTSSVGSKSGGLTRLPKSEVGYRVPDNTTSITVGWTDCGHDDWRPGVVLDPFAGSGTTLMVATGHGRDAIGCDIDERNAELALERVGPMFFSAFSLAEWVDQRAVS